MKVKEYGYPSSSGICTIKAWQWYPDDENVKAVIQFHHGMAEHSKRYYQTMESLTDLGYAVFMNDMINHGESCQDKTKLGYFGDKDGFKRILDDAKTLTDIAKNKYPNVPFIIIGHSMGSFVMRSYINAFTSRDIDAAIFSGTSGPNPLTSISIGVTTLVGKLKGKDYHSKFIGDLSNKGYNDKTSHRTNFDWLTKDEKIVDDYIKDEKCGYYFTAQGYQDLARLLMDCNDDKWYANVAQSLPVLLISGADDPVGAYGEGVKFVYDKLKNTHHENVSMKLYDGCRHEILNDSEKEQVIKDIDDFITTNVNVKQLVTK